MKTTCTPDCHHVSAALISSNLALGIFGTDACFCTVLLPPVGMTFVLCRVHTSCDSHEQAARQLGLVQDSEECLLAFQEDITFSTPRELRQPLDTLIIAGAPARTLWESHSNRMTSAYSMRMFNSFAPTHGQQARNVNCVCRTHTCYSYRH